MVQADGNLKGRASSFGGVYADGPRFFQKNKDGSLSQKSAAPSFHVPPETEVKQMPIPPIDEHPSALKTTLPIPNEEKQFAGGASSDKNTSEEPTQQTSIAEKDGQQQVGTAKKDEGAVSGGWGISGAGESASSAAVGMLRSVGSVRESLDVDLSAVSFPSIGLPTAASFSMGWGGIGDQTQGTKI